MPAPPVPVASYRMSLNPGQNKSRITIKLTNGKEIPIDPSDSAEFAAIAALLNQSPVMYFLESGTLTTEWEQT